MDICDSVLVALRKIIRATDLYSKRLSKETSLTAPQLLIMQAIRDCGRVSIGEIASKVNLSQATVTTILDRLEKRELTFRERSKTDKRKVHAHLTAEGERLLDSAPMPLQEEFIRKFRELKDWEQTLILSSLQRVAEMMDAGNIDASPLLDLGAVDRHQASDKVTERDSNNGLKKTAQ